MRQGTATLVARWGYFSRVTRDIYRGWVWGRIKFSPVFFCVCDLFPSIWGVQEKTKGPVFGGFSTLQKIAARHRCGFRKEEKPPPPLHGFPDLDIRCPDLSIFVEISEKGALEKGYLHEIVRNF